MRYVPFFWLAAGLLAAAGPRPYFAEPSVSPDGSEIAFVSGGDIWTVPAAGGEARLLVSHPAAESRPLYSPDGSRLAFVSERTGNGDIHVLTLATGEVRRLTYDSGSEMLDGWSRDGVWVYFSSSSGDIAGMRDVYRVRAGGGTPMQVTADRYASEYFSAPSPGGTALAFSARGIAAAQWWRNGHSHIDEAEIWLLRDGRYESVTTGGAKEMWPMWSRDGKTLYYVSDRSGAENIWARPLAGKPRQVTAFTAGRVLWPAISAAGNAIVFERDFSVWKLDVESGRAAPVAITRRGAPAGAAVQHLSLNSFQDMALSPDGKKLALVAHGEIFAASARDGGDAARITRTAAPESQPEWAPDSRRLAYASAREGQPHLYLYDFRAATETRLTSGGADTAPRWSPDGKTIAFERNGRELRVVDVETGQERLLAAGLFDKPPLNSPRAHAWSPDGKWVAYLATGTKLFRNASVVPAAGGEGRPVSFLANGGADTICWSPDGKYLLFETGQRTEDTQVARIDLVPRTPVFREDRFQDLFQEAAAQEKKDGPAAVRARNGGKPVEIAFEGIRARLSLLPVGLDVDSQSVSPDGKWLLLTAAAAGRQNLYVYPLDELAREAPVARQLTSTAGRKSAAQWGLDSKEVFYLEQGRVNSIGLESRQAKAVAVTGEMDVDFSIEKMEIFRQAWTYLRDHFFDPKFHGVDWEAKRGEFEPLIEGARTSGEMRRLLSLMIGELNASHLGVSPPPGAAQGGAARLGVRFDRAEYESTGRLKVAEVIRLGPAALAGIRPGDVILEVDGVPAGAQVNLDALLEYKVNRRVALKLENRQVAVRPVSLGTEKNLLYRQWVEERREYVAKASAGRLGYVHMPDMSAQSLAQLAVDLDTENHAREGVVIDVRNNNGGFVNVYAIDVLARRPYLKMTVRDMPEAPARSVLGQRALEAPTILVTNQHALSDAEDFTEGYRSLGLGKVVGEPTAGWIVYTWNVQLLDGTGLRLPRTRVTTAKGEDMEMHPRPVDIPVERPIGESYTGRDTQLDTAVKALLEQIGEKK